MKNRKASKRLKKVDHVFVFDRDHVESQANEIMALFIDEITTSGPGCDHDYQPCEHEAISEFDKCSKCGKIS